METADKIRELRERTGMTRKDFAMHIGIPLRTVEDWEAGRRRPPEYIPRLISYQLRYEELMKKMEEGYDIVIGSRFVGAKKPLSMRMIGSRLIEWAIRLTTGVTIKDPTSGLRMFNQNMIREFAGGLNYGPEPDTVSYLIKAGARVAEIPVIMDERVQGASYLTPVKSVFYMAKILLSILLIQSFRKREG